MNQPRDPDSAPLTLSSYPSGQSWVVTIANPEGDPHHTLRFRVDATCADVS